MTREECIQKIKALDIENNCSADVFIYDELYALVHRYDPDLCYFFEDYFKENYVWQVIWDNCRYLSEVADELRYIDRYSGVYYRGDYGWETADLCTLRDLILRELEREEDTLVNNNEEEWIEEEDDFLTKEVKQ